MTLLLFLLLSVSFADQASTSAAQAAYKQTGAEEYVNTLVRNLDKEYLSNDLRSEGVAAFFLLQCTVRHEISFKWEF